jgi:hypothetical protein
MKIVSVTMNAQSPDVIEAQGEDGSLLFFWLDDRAVPHRVTPVWHSVDGKTVETLIVNDGVRPIQLPLRVRIVP